MATSAGSGGSDHVLGQAARRRVAEAGADAHALIVVMRRDDLTLAMDGCQHVATVVWDHQFDDLAECPQPVPQGEEERVDSLAADGADGHRTLVALDEVCS